jgi:hypothetical protein
MCTQRVNDWLTEQNTDSKNNPNNNECVRPNEFFHSLLYEDNSDEITKFGKLDWAILNMLADILSNLNCHSVSSILQISSSLTGWL